MKYVKVSSYKKSKVKFRLWESDLGFTKPRYYKPQDLHLIGSDFSKNELSAMVDNKANLGVVIDGQNVGDFSLERTLDALDFDY